MTNASILLNLHEFEKNLLLQFISYTKQHDYDHVTLSTLRDMARELGIPAALRENVIGKLKNLNVFYMDNNLDSRVKIHPAFHEEALPYYSDIPNSLEHNVPAADRFVSINHNTVEFTETVESLERLEDRIKSSNELSATPEERLVLSKEISVLREALNQPLVRLSSIWVATKHGVLPWLVQHSTDAVLNALAIEVIGHLQKLFGGS